MGGHIPHFSRNATFFFPGTSGGSKQSTESTPPRTLCVLSPSSCAFVGGLALEKNARVRAVNAVFFCEEIDLGARAILGD